MKLVQQYTEHLSSRIFGQNHVVEALAPRLAAARLLSVRSSGAPVGAFILAGPTGTGKTAFVQAVSEAVHGVKPAANGAKILRIDCAGYQMEHEVARLIGAPPGYLGHRETRPILSNTAIAGKTSDASPVSIVLFDEIEKAAPSLMRLLLSVLDTGELSLGDNSKAYFSRSLIFFTTNLGYPTAAAERGVALPGVAAASTTTASERRVLDAIRRHFSPEFLGRISRLGGVHIFHALSETSLQKIVQAEMDEVNKVMREAFVCPPKVVAKASVLKLALTECSSRLGGVRDLQGWMHENVLIPALLIAEELSSSERGPTVLSAEVSGGRVVLRAVRVASVGGGVGEL